MIKDSLVDTGAKRSVIDFTELKDRNTFIIRKSSTPWIAVDQQLLPVMGEVTLSVRFQGAVVDLDNVLVMENLVYPLILGADWIAKGNISIRFNDGEWIVERHPTSVVCGTTMPSSGIPRQILASLDEGTVEEEALTLAKLLFDPHDVADEPRSESEETDTNKESLLGLVASTQTIVREPQKLHEPMAILERVIFPDSLDDSTKRDILQILDRHPGCFTKDRKGTTYGVHVIDTGESKPIRCHPRRVSEAERIIISEHVRKMLEAGVITPSKSPWNSPVVLVPKKDGSMRFCVDFRKLNAVTKRDIYPLPIIEEVVSRLSGSTVFTKLDLESGFWQVPVAERDQEKTAFTVPDGAFQFNRMPFGLSGAPSTFQRLMDSVLAELKWKDCLVYMDDVLIFGADVEEHNQRLDRVLCALEEAKLTLNLEKSLFGSSSITYLGHCIDKNGVSPDPQKLEAIEKFPKPTTLTQLRAFLGLASYYRRFISGFASIAQPLHNLLKKGSNVTEDWSDIHEQAMQELKKRLTSAPVLAFDDGKSDLRLYTDASSQGIGAVLTQKTGKEYLPLVFLSRRLKPAEEKYHSNEQECLALVWAIDKCKPYTYGRQLEVMTDNSVLSWLTKKTDITGKYARWILALQDHSLDVKHISGKANIVADALSRAPLENEDDAYQVNNLVATIQTKRLSNRQLALLQHADEDIRLRVLKLQGYGKRDTDDIELGCFRLKKGVLYRTSDKVGRPELLVVPSILRKDLLEECHDKVNGGHHGVEKTANRLSQRYWWAGYHRSVKAFIQSCEFCQSFKSTTGLPSGKLEPIPPPKQPFETVGIDHLGPLKLTPNGFQHIIVCIDYLTRWVEVAAVPDTSVEPVKRFLKDQVFLRHGTPARIVSDRGPAFASKQFDEFLQEWNVQHVMSTPEHPQTNGLVERMNRTLTSTLAAYLNLNQDDWDIRLQDATFSINTARQSTTELTPFELTYGRTAVLSHELGFPWPTSPTVSHQSRIRQVAKWRRTARRLICERQMKSKKETDKYRRPNQAFDPGDLVLVSRKPREKGKTRKFLPKFIGPFQILKRLTRTTYVVEDMPANRRKRIHRRFNAHTCQLRKYHARAETEWRPEYGDEPEGEYNGGKQQTDLFEHVEPIHHEQRKEPSPEQNGIRQDPPVAVVTRSGRVSRPVVRF